MRRRAISYSRRELAFVEARASMRRRVLHALFVAAFGRTDVTQQDLRALCVRRGWTTRVQWNADEDGLLRELYADTKSETIAQRLGRPLASVYQRAKKIGLQKSAAYLASADASRLRRGDNVGAPFRFPKSRVPANKGVKRGRGWAPGHMAKTQFKKGESRNRMPIGAERLVDGYRYTKVSDVPHVPYTVNWKPTHRLRWEAVHGSLPEGHALKALDGDRLNVEPANWIAVPRAMLPLLNGRNGVHYDAAPAELKPTLLAMARVRHASNTRDGLTPVERMLKTRRERAHV